MPDSKVLNKLSVSLDHLFIVFQPVPFILKIPAIALNFSAKVSNEMEFILHN